MMIHLEGINKTYFNGAPLHVLKGIDLDIEKGEMVSIMGASGSGKSTLLDICLLYTSSNRQRKETTGLHVNSFLLPD